LRKALWFIAIDTKFIFLPNTEMSREIALRYFKKGILFTSLLIAGLTAMSQVPKFAQVLPVGKSHSGRSHKEPEIAFGPDILVEPSIQEVLEQVLKREVAGLIFRAMLEGAASEHGARMTAMDSATNNANEVLRRMKIQYNRARQAAITKELIEITSGAQAL
jgi:F-type H+-transporting ATPase subunit gamma